MKNRRKKPGVKLTRAQKKKLEELTRQAKADGRHPSSAQKTIPYLSMYKDGLCRVTENYYTMSLLFDDMNYDLEDEAEQLGIFGGWCSFYSYFDCAESNRCGRSGVRDGCGARGRADFQNGV